jgi:hypothetical protein
MTAHHTPTPLETLLAKVDAVLRATGGDPATVSTDDKIMLAVQYIEVCTVLAVMDITAHAGRVRL